MSNGFYKILEDTRIFQNRCKFYNYNLTQTTPLKAALPQPASVTMNFYGTVHGAAGTVQGDQTIQP